MNLNKISPRVRQGGVYLGKERQYSSNQNLSSGFLSELQSNAQLSIQKKLKLKTLPMEEPIERKTKQKSRKIIKEMVQLKRTKQPSLPYIAQKDKGFYDKWYIPYDQRFVLKPNIGNEEQFADEMYFYKNMQDINFNFDPFEDKVPDNIKKTISYKQRSDALKEMFKGSRIVLDFKKCLEKQQTRVPGFIKKIAEEKL